VINSEQTRDRLYWALITENKIKKHGFGHWLMIDRCYSLAENSYEHCLEEANKTLMATASSINVISTS
jgi:hypothetical protein